MVKRQFVVWVSSACLGYGTFIQNAHGQERNTADPTPDTQLTEVVVTGTQIRGAAPIGTNLIALSSEDIAKTGAVSTNQLLESIPQISSNFNQVATLPTNNPGLSIVYPNIRNIPAGGATTLTLVNGHRVGGSGGFAALDPDILPPSVIQKVEIVPDGGSSIYGSDAIGGVIDLVTKKRFDGFEVGAREGIGGHYHAFDTDLTAGKDWGDGSAYISYSYAKSNEVLGRDLSYVRQFAPNLGYCYPGTVAVTRGGATTTYALPGLVPNTLTNCDNTDGTTVFPALERHSAFASLTESISDTVEVGATAFFTIREAVSRTDVNFPGQGGAQTGTITPANPFYMPIAPDPGSQSVNFSYQGLQDNGRLNRLQQFGITPNVTVSLPGDWQLRALGTYGASHMNFSQPDEDSTAQNNALAATTPATALDPYNPSLTSPTILRGIFVTDTSISASSYADGRVIIDGSPLALPGGALKVAMGGEASHESLRNTLTGTYNGVARTARHIYSGFTEVAVPVFDADNAVSGIQSLLLSGSARYDKYSDSGGTFNPKLGLDYKPISWITARGNWGKAFNAPQLGDTGAAADTRAVLIFSNPFFNPSTPEVSGRPSAILAGGNPNLKPQKATTWSAGLDISPPIVEGLKLSTTYYNIKMTNNIAITPIFTPALAYSGAYAPYVIQNPTLAQSQAIIGNLPLVGYPSVAAWYNANPAGPPAVILDARRQNFGVYKQDGLDFNATYDEPTSFGSVNAAIGGTYSLDRRVAALAGQAFVNEFDAGFSRLQLVASVGAAVGPFSANAKLSHSAGYYINPAIGSQNHVSNFDVVDLYLAYSLSGPGLAKGLQVTAFLGNVFNKIPPYYNADPGYTNGSTLGRIAQVGIRKKF